MEKIEAVPTLFTRQEKQERILKEIFGLSPEILSKKYKDSIEFNQMLIGLLNSSELEEQLKNPELPDNLDVFYAPFDDKGSGDGYQIDGNEVSIFDVAGEGEASMGIKTLIYEAWKGIKKNFPEKDWYQELDNFLLEIRERAGLPASFSTSMAMVRLEKDKLRLFAPAGEITIVIRDPATQEVKTDLRADIIKHKSKLGAFTKAFKQKMPSDALEMQSLEIPKDSQLILCTDGVIFGEWEQRETADGPSNFEKDLEKIAQEQNFYQKFKELVKTKLRKEKMDDATMICINPK